MKFWKNFDRNPYALIAFGVILFLGINNIHLLFEGMNYVTRIAFPFLLGSCIAFIVNVPMRFFENKVFKNIKHGKRGLSLIIALACIVGVIVIVSGLIIPELADTVNTLANNVPGYLKEIQESLDNAAKKYPAIQTYVSQLDMDWNRISMNLMNFLQGWASGMLDSTVNVISGAVQVVIGFVLGFVFSINALLKKETLTLQVKKLMFAFLPVTASKRIVRIGRLSNHAFSSFLSGQCIEACILGTLIFLAMTILGIPYALLVAVVIGVASLVPIVGGFIGCFIGVVLILMISWQKALIFLIMYIVIQQIEGNLIYPHVVGNSVGLPAIWVLVAVTIGGNIAGVVGMLFSIPLCSVLYQLLSEVVNYQIQKRGLDKTIKDA